MSSFIFDFFSNIKINKNEALICLYNRVEWIRSVVFIYEKNLLRVQIAKFKMADLIRLSFENFQKLTHFDETLYQGFSCVAKYEFRMEIVKIKTVDID